MHLLRQRNRTELPVFPDGTKIAKSSAVFCDAKLRDEFTYGDYAVRAIRVFSGGSKLSLDKLLKVADDLFERYAEASDAIVIPHTWGLYKDPDSNQHDVTNALIPENHSLVARVAILSEIKEPNYKQSCRIRESVKKVNKKSRFIWTDSAPHQFMQGILPEQTEQKLVLLDIEPLVRPK